MGSFILDKAHDAVRAVVREGDTTIDATVGNGWDTVFLARLVGPTGRVIGLDVQADALENARRLLDSHGSPDPEIPEISGKSRPGPLVQAGTPRFWRF